MNDLSEKEQLDELRAWWQENRAFVIGILVLGVAVLIGVSQYSSSRVDAELEASSRYEALVDAVAEDDLDPASEIADELFDDYGSTVYADQARLAMARLYMDRGRDADAADVLRPLATGGNEPIELVARLRLARILLYQDKPQEVIDLLQAPEDSAFLARFNEALGDAHVALGNVDAAAAAYEAVLADARGQQTVDVNFVRMKLQDLPVGGEPGAGSSGAAADDAPQDGAPE